MGDVALPIGATNAGTNDWSDVHGEDQAIVDVVNGGIDNDNIDATADIAYSKLASASTGKALIGNAGVATMTTLSGDVTVGATGVTAVGATKVTAAMLNADTQAVYQTILDRSGRVPRDQAAATLTLSKVGGATTLIANNVSFTEGTLDCPDMVYLDDADFTLASLTPQLRIRAQCAANATSPGTMTFIVGLYPVTVSGGSDVLAFSLGTVVSGSTATVTYTGDGTNTIRSHTSGGADFSVPTDGAYALGVVTNATLANNSSVSVHAQLQQRLT